MGLSEEKQEVVAFGALALLQNGASLLLLLLLALLTGVLPEAVLALLTAGVLRHATGGTHLQTPLRCVATTALFFWGAGYAGQVLAATLVTRTASLILAAPILTAGLWTIYRWAPVEAENRPLSPNHKASLRRLSLRLGWIVSAILLVGAFLTSWWWAPCLLGFLIQCTSLTPPGHKFTSTIDSICNRLQGR